MNMKSKVSNFDLNEIDKNMPIMVLSDTATFTIIVK